MNITKSLYWVTTILVCTVMMYSATMYFTKTEMIKGFFESFNYPTYLVYPLAIAKILGVIMVLWRKSSWLTEWAYAGFFFDLILATAAHQAADHGLGLSFYTTPILLISYFLGKRSRSQ